MRKLLPMPPASTRRVKSPGSLSPAFLLELPHRTCAKLPSNQSFAPLAQSFLIRAPSARSASPHRRNAWRL